MHKDLKQAVEILNEEKRALVLVRDGEILMKDDRRGIGPIYEIAAGEKTFVLGSSLADKVIGKAAAMLAADAGIARLYAVVLSEEAERVLIKARIDYDYEKKVPYIQNREKDGRCPMEKLAGDLNYDETHILKKRLEDFLKSFL